MKEKTSFLIFVLTLIFGTFAQEYPAFFNVEIPQYGEDAEVIKHGPLAIGVPDENDAYSVQDLFNTQNEEDTFDGHFEDEDESLQVQDPGCPEPPEHIPEPLIEQESRLLGMVRHGVENQELVNLLYTGNCDVDVHIVICLRYTQVSTHFFQIFKNF